MKLMLFIPAYKTEHEIISVLERIPENIRKKAAEIVVMDNSSPDNLFDRVMEYKKKKKMAKLKIYRHSKNLLYGGNEKAGCEYAVKHGMDIVVVVHSDGHYPPEHIAQLIMPIEEEKADTVFGSRISGRGALRGGMPIWRFSGNILLTFVENLITGTRFSEWHSGFRAYSCKALRVLPFKECVSGYEWTTDIYLLFLANRFRIAEIPIPTHYGKESTSPSIKTTFLYFCTSTALALNYLLTRFRIRNIHKYRPVRK